MKRRAITCRFRGPVRPLRASTLGVLITALGGCFVGGPIADESGTDGTGDEVGTTDDDEHAGSDDDTGREDTTVADGSTGGADDAAETGETTGDDDGSAESDGLVESVCGDGIVDGPEACDDGDDNSDTRPDACRLDCTLPRCGDEVVDAAEDCDDANLSQSDGCLSTCVTPTSCAAILDEVPDVPDGAYIIVPDGDPLETFCDMTTDGGGWTLVAKVNNADADGVPEPVGWFGITSDGDGLRSPALALNASPQSHGAARFAAILDEGTSLTRFELVHGGDVERSVAWYKRVASIESFEAWFSEQDPAVSEVCTDVAMTLNCSDGDIGRSGSDANNVTVLGGMRITDVGFPDGDSFAVHMRQDNNTGSATSGVISGTIGLVGWTPGYGGHDGNGLRIYLRE